MYPRCRQNARTDCSLASCSEMIRCHNSTRSARCRFMLLACTGQLTLSYWCSPDAYCELTQTWRDVNSNSYRACAKVLQECEWFRVYDLIEAIHLFLAEKRSSAYYSRADEFAQTVNKALIKYHVGWRVTPGGKIAIRGDALFDATMTTAVYRR